MFIIHQQIDSFCLTIKELGNRFLFLQRRGRNRRAPQSPPLGVRIALLHSQIPETAD